VASELSWKGKGLRVEQRTRFPEEEETRLTFHAATPVPLALKIRHPAWAVSGLTVDVNGKREPGATAPGSYVTVAREWRDGDVVTVRVPMGMRVEPLPGDAKTVALFYGPILLAGDLGRDGLTDAVRYGPGAPPVRRLPPVEVPALVASDPGTLLAAVKPAGAPLTFKTAGIGHPHDVTLLPFYKASDQRYTVYWKLASAAEWEKQQSDAAAAERERRGRSDQAFDRVDIDDPQAETAHGYRGESTGHWDYEGRGIRETRGGWFSYEMKVLPDRPMVLGFTYLGSEGRPRLFDVMVDGQTIATKTVEYHPTELLDAEYPIPIALTRGKEKVTVRFQAQPDASSAPIFEVRLTAAPAQEH
jgi:hypothetical protein